MCSVGWLRLILWRSVLCFLWVVTDCREFTLMGIASNNNSFPEDGKTVNYSLDYKSSLDDQPAELNDDNEGDNTICSSFDSYGPPQGAMFYVTQTFQISCVCSETTGNQSQNQCPHLKVQSGTQYLRQWTNWTMDCKTGATYQVVSGPQEGIGSATVQCLFPGSGSRTAFYQVNIHSNPDPVDFENSSYLNSKSVLVLCAILACIISLFLINGCFGMYCRIRRYNSSSRSQATSDGHSPQRRTSTANQDLTSISQGIQQDLPPTYTEAVLRHQETGELPPSYSNALMAAISQLKKGSTPQPESASTQDLSSPGACAATSQDPGTT